MIDKTIVPTVNDISYSFNDIDSEHTHLSISILVDSKGQKSELLSGMVFAHDRKGIGHFRLFSYTINFHYQNQQDSHLVLTI